MVIVSAIIYMYFKNSYKLINNELLNIKQFFTKCLMFIHKMKATNKVFKDLIYKIHMFNVLLNIAFNKRQELYERYIVSLQNKINIYDVTIKNTIKFRTIKEMDEYNLSVKWYLNINAFNDWIENADFNDFNVISSAIDNYHNIYSFDTDMSNRIECLYKIIDKIGYNCNINVRGLYLNGKAPNFATAYILYACDYDALTYQHFGEQRLYKGIDLLLKYKVDFKSKFMYYCDEKTYYDIVFYLGRMTVKNIQNYYGGGYNRMRYYLKNHKLLQNDINVSF